MALPINMLSGVGVLEYWSNAGIEIPKSQITLTKVSVFRFQVSAFVFFLPDT